MFERGIASCPTVKQAIRETGNASDKNLTVVTPVDLDSILPQVPKVKALFTTGGKATEVLLDLLNEPIAGKTATIVPILRAGLGMLDGVLDLIPTAKISVVGLQRDEETLQPVPFFEKFVSHMDKRPALIIDPMLATGGSMVATIEMLKRNGCTNIKALVLVAAPEGVRLVNEAHPDVTIYTAALDSHLDEHGYIIPGLGDAGDKIFGKPLANK